MKPIASLCAAALIAAPAFAADKPGAAQQQRIVTGQSLT